MDSKWPRASEWIRPGASGDFALLGVPANSTSLSPTQAHLTPAAIRAALSKYSPFSPAWQKDLSEYAFVDLGDVATPDEDEEGTIAEIASAVSNSRLLVALGGDNSITYAVARGANSDAVITFDAHHDVREGRSNGSPIRRLIDSGIPGHRIVQIGIADFANSADYSRWAREQGIHVLTRHDVSELGIIGCVVEALNRLDGAMNIHVDVDVDVCDRSVAPGCPASAPGGISAAELRDGVRTVVRDPRVRTLDITEIDASADTPDKRTIRLGALLVLETALGFALR